MIGLLVCVIIRIVEGILCVVRFNMWGWFKGVGKMMLMYMLIILWMGVIVGMYCLVWGIRVNGHYGSYIMKIIHLKHHFIKFSHTQTILILNLPQSILTNNS
jgi:hypothetical protein